MDFKNFFNVPGEQELAGEKKDKSPQDMVKELLKEAVDAFEQDNKSNGPIDQKRAAELFLNKFGSIREFLLTHYPTLTEPYENAALKAIKDKVSSDGKPVSGPVLAGGLLEASRFFALKILQENAGSQEEAALEGLKAAALGSAISKSLPEGTPMDDMIAIVALTAIASLKLAQLSAFLEAQQLAEDENNR